MRLSMLSGSNDGWVEENRADPFFFFQKGATATQVQFSLKRVSSSVQNKDFFSLFFILISFVTK